ncbi:hypothetical protein M5689_021223 [Euphorbia peplus]|nr:hypothetical protein M5689_021223 [Euphorbia peplus]
MLFSFYIQSDKKLFLQLDLVYLVLHDKLHIALIIRGHGVKQNRLKDSECFVYVARSEAASGFSYWEVAAVLMLEEKGGQSKSDASHLFGKSCFTLQDKDGSYCRLEAAKQLGKWPPLRKGIVLLEAVKATEALRPNWIGKLLRRFLIAFLLAPYSL